jgi:hypothetical protein
MPGTEEILPELLKLPVVERARLATELVRSLIDRKTLTRLRSDGRA